MLSDVILPFTVECVGLLEAMTVSWVELMWYIWDFPLFLKDRYKECIRNVCCVHAHLSYIFSQQEKIFFSAAELLVMYFPIKQPQGLLCSKWKLHECWITFTRSHEYLNVYNDLLGRTHGHWGYGETTYTEKSLWKLNMGTCLPDYLA